MTLFSDLPTVRYEGEGSTNPLAYRYYDPDKVVLGKPLREQLRLTVCYWHSFVMNGADPFGAPTILRPWMGGADPMAAARAKADAAFDLFRALDVPLYSFHDRDIAPEGDTLAETLKNTRAIGDYFAERQQATGMKLLWGTANLFSHPRFMAGASTNPDPDVFAWSAATVKTALDVTHALGGANYVMWGGREGYETLLNTDLKRELDNMGRFLSLVVDYKHKIGFSGPILIEPKPKEPTKHQYDFDAATVYGFLKHYGLEKDVKLNLEENHAILAGHTFEHEIAVANAFGILGSLDINRGDPLLGWDTDQFPNDVPQLTLALYEVIKGGGLTTGGLNFDAKIRRQSIEADDLLHAHVGGIDICAKAFLQAAKLYEEGHLAGHVRDRYAGWDKAGHAASGATLEEIAATAESRNLSPTPRSGRQEMLENIVSRG